MGKSEKAEYDFFISYASEDRDWAEWIYWHLEEEGHSCFMQAWDFKDRQNFISAMQEGLTKGGKTIAVLSRDYFTSDYAEAEWTAAYHAGLKQKKRLLISVLVRKCDPPGLLANVPYTRLDDTTDEAEARRRLLEGVSCEACKRATAPAFPQPTVAEKPAYPGGLPPVFTVPHRRNPNFTGRAEYLDALHEALASGEAAALTQETTQAIHGLGGVGKTQLAI